jgi:hypothetical protein
MKKHRYSATDIKRVNWASLVEQTAGKALVLGVDVAKEDFFDVLMRSDLSVCTTLKWRHPIQPRALSEHLGQDLGVERLDVLTDTWGQSKKLHFGAFCGSLIVVYVQVREDGLSSQDLSMGSAATCCPAGQQPDSVLWS